VKENDIQYIAVDLRDNPGGNSSVADEFIRYLNIEKYYITGGCDIRYGPFLKKYSKSITKNKQIEDLVFKGKTYVLTSTQTFSSAMMFATILSDNQIGEIIGEIPGHINLPLIPDYEVDANNAIHQLYEIIHQKES
jgi:C-terminal processing protease CtpA/Prc